MMTPDQLANIQRELLDRAKHFEQPHLFPAFVPEEFRRSIANFL